MSLKRRTPREVLGDKSGIATSITDVLGGIGLKSVVLVAVGGTLATLFTFWAVSAASTDASASFQTTNLTFEKEVKEADVVVGIDTTRVGLLKNVGDDCEVQTWQASSRGDKTTLQVDVDTVAGECASTTPLLAAGSAEDSRELLYDIDTPTFTYANLGGRAIEFDDAGAASLASATRPEDVKKIDWDDTRPHKVTLTLKTLSEDAAAVTKKAVATGFTEITNVAAPEGDQRYVPAPSDDPVPGPVTISGVTRSTTTGATYAGVREGIKVTFNGGVCVDGPSKVEVSYTQQSPSAAVPVNAVLEAVLTGEAKSIHLTNVPNGATGTVEVAVQCLEGGVTEKQTALHTQPVPPTILTVAQNAVKENHDLSWIAVSSLPTTFEVRRTPDGASESLLGTTSSLTYQSTFEAGANLGLKVDYSVIAVVDDVRSPKATGSITTPMATPAAATVTGSAAGASWAAVACEANATPQYAERHYQQTGTSTAVSWSNLTTWATSRTAFVTTPAYGRTVFEVQTRCVATKTGAISPTSTSANASFYVPEALTVSVARSTTTGTAYEGAREGATILHSGGRCYNGTASTINLKWVPATPTGQSNVSAPSNSKVQPATVQSVDISNVKNGAKGAVESTVTCNGVTTATASKSTAYTQSLPKPVLTVTQGTTNNRHQLDWNKVSSLSTSFQIAKTAEAGTQNESPAATTELGKELVYTAGTNFGNKTSYSVTATVNGISQTSSTKSITTAWPTNPKAEDITYKRTGAGGIYQGGTITWSYSANCPGGTTLQGRLLENRWGRSDGTVDQTVKHTTAWTDGMVKYTWAPDYSRQGFRYSVRVESYCKSDVTGIKSSTAATQADRWTTPMEKPAKPVWDGFNLKDKERGTDWTWSSPLDGSEKTIVADYKDYCPQGSKLGWTTYTATDWLGDKYSHEWGWYGYWKIDTTSEKVVYGNAKYSCDTPWTTSPVSEVSSNKTITVRKNK